MKNHHIFAWNLACLLLISCGGDNPAALDEAKIKAQGNKAVIELKTRLKGELLGAMEKGGPIAAISHCQNIAPELTAASAAGQPGMVVRRTSSRVRNPDNEPDAVDRRVLGIFQAAKDRGAEIPDEHLVWPSGSGGSDQVARYYQALFIQPLCLNCHGEKTEMQNEVTELLDKLYPNDQATGYKLGDLRGLVRVDMEIADGSE